MFVIAVTAVAIIRQYMWKLLIYRSQVVNTSQALSALFGTNNGSEFVHNFHADSAQHTWAFISLRRHRVVGMGIPIIDPRRSSDRGDSYTHMHQRRGSSREPALTSRRFDTEAQTPAKFEWKWTNSSFMQMHLCSAVILRPHCAK